MFSRKRTLSQEYITGLHSEVLSVNQYIHNDFLSLTGKQINWKPEPHKWSIAQCFDHLILANNIYLTEIEKTLLSAKKFKSKEIVFKSGFFAKILLHYTSPASAKKFESLDAFKPSTDFITKEVFNNFNGHQGRLLSVIKNSEELDLNVIKIAHPLKRILKLSLGDFLNLIITHEKRHLQQAKRIIDHPGFM